LGDNQSQKQVSDLELKEVIDKCALEATAGGIKYSWGGKW